MRQLLGILSDGQVHSGADLALALGVSRTAIWKQLKHLQSYNLSVEAVRGQGYCIPGGVDLLDVEALRHALGQIDRAEVGLEVFDSLPSTNSHLMAAPDTIAAFDVCLAEQQTAGRGRRGRLWASPFAQNLYVSLAFDRAAGFEGLEGLSLVAGVAVVRALQSLGVTGLGLKWPNDIWLNGRKLGGILVELQGEFQAPCRVVIGLGLNVHMRGEGVSIDQPWTSLAMEANDTVPRRTQLAAALISSLIDSVEGFLQGGFAPWVDAWQVLDVFSGKPIRTLPGEVTGVGRGIDASGAYLLEGDGSVQRIVAGEVSLRAAV